MADSRKMIKGLASFSIVPAVSGLIAIFVIPTVSHVFPEAEYGKINLFYSTGNLLMTVCMLGLDSSQIRYYFEPPKGLTDRAVQAIALLVGLAVDALMVTVTLLFFPLRVSEYLYGENNVPLVVCLGVFVASLVAFRVINTDARMQGRAGRYNVQAILQNLITKISFVAMAFLVSTRYDVSIVAMTVMMALTVIVFMIGQRDRLSFEDATITLSNIRVLLAFGIPAMTTSFALNLNGMVGKLALTDAGLYSDLGVFAVATSISNVFVIIPTAFTTWWSPFMYEHYQTDQETICKVHDLVMCGTILIVAAIVALQEVLFVVVGGEYVMCQSYFMLVMLNPIQGLICETTGYGVVLEEKPVYNVIATVAGIAASAVVTLTLLDSLGAMAAALGVAVSSIVIGVIRSVLGQRFYRSVSHPFRSLVAVLIVIAACCANSYVYSSLALQVAFGGLLALSAILLYREELIGLMASLRDK